MSALEDNPAWIEVDTFDIVVVGTGVVESIVAAAAARVGKKVLHLDHKEYYGGSWATFGLNELVTWVESQPSATGIGEPELDLSRSGTPDESVVRIQKAAYEASPSHTNIVLDRRTHEKFENPVYEAFNARRFAIDLSPRLLPCRGDLVDTLIASGVGQYVEFKPLAATYVLEVADGDNDNARAAFRKVPSSKDDIFTDSSLSPIEKRKLMKFLKACMDDEFVTTAKYLDNKSAPFYSYLTSLNLSASLQSFIMYAIALIPSRQDETAKADEIVDLEEGVARMRSFLESLGRYGPTSFLYPLYGVSELCQGFCRHCAVNGGFYILRRGAQGFVLDSERHAAAVLAENQALKADWFVCGADYAASFVGDGGEEEQEAVAEAASEDVAEDAVEEDDAGDGGDEGGSAPATPPGTGSTKGKAAKETRNFGREISRAVVITAEPVLEGEGVNALILPPGSVGNDYCTNVVQVDDSAQCAPAGFYVVHLSTVASGESAGADLASAVELLFDTTTGGLERELCRLNGPDETTITATVGAAVEAETEGEAGEVVTGESDSAAAAPEVTEGAVAEGGVGAGVAVEGEVGSGANVESDTNDNNNGGGNSNGDGDADAMAPTAPEAEVGGSGKPVALMLMYFNQTVRESGKSRSPFDNVLVAPDLGYSFDMDLCVGAAADIFATIFAGTDTEFMADLPPPEDYVIEEEEDFEVRPEGDDGVVTEAVEGEGEAGSDAVGADASVGGGDGSGEPEAEAGAEREGEGGETADTEAATGDATVGADAGEAVEAAEVAVESTEECEK